MFEAWEKVETKEKFEIKEHKEKKERKRTGLFGRVGGFFREVISELGKVIWPTRKELLTYTAVVIVFVAIIMTIVGLLDTGFAWSSYPSRAVTRSSLS